MLKNFQYQNITWIDIQDPKPKDIDYLRQNFQFHEMVLGELIPPGHRAKVEQYGDYLFFILYYPYFDEQKREIVSKELDILVTKTHIVTSHYEPISPLKALWGKIQHSKDAQLEPLSGNTGVLLSHIIRGILEKTLVKLEFIEKQVDDIEKEIFKGKEREMVPEISVARRDIIDFRRILAPQKAIIDSLAAEGPVFFGRNLEPYFADLTGIFGIVWNEIEQNRETIQALAETNESLLATKTNEAIKVLTVLSVLFLPITFMANLWGMNIDAMPLGEHLVGFWIVIGVMAAVLLLTTLYFKLQKWL